MKKLLAVISLTLVLFSLPAADFNVLVYPENREISRLIEKWFPSVTAVSQRYVNSEIIEAGRALSVAWNGADQTKIRAAQNALEKAGQKEASAEKYNVKLVSYRGTVTPENMELLDPGVLSYVCRQANSDILVVPLRQILGDFYNLTLSVWSESTGTVETVYLKLRQNSELYTEECLYALAPYFLTAEELEFFSTDVEAAPGFILPAYEIKSDVKADVLLNEKYAGTTPLVLENIKVPSILRLEAEGYAPASINIDGTDTSWTVEMKPLWMNDGQFYNKARKDFYTGFALTLGAFGLKVVANSITFGNATVRQWVNYASEGLIAVSLVNLVYGLFEYFTSAYYLSR